MTSIRAHVAAANIERRAAQDARQREAYGYNLPKAKSSLKLALEMAVMPEDIHAEPRGSGVLLTVEGLTFDWSPAGGGEIHLRAIDGEDITEVFDPRERKIGSPYALADLLEQFESLQTPPEPEVLVLTTDIRVAKWPTNEAKRWEPTQDDVEHALTALAQNYNAGGWFFVGFGSVDVGHTKESLAAYAEKMAH